MIEETYMQFFRMLNKNQIEWCIIKDYYHLLNHYDHEIDLTSLGKYRKHIRKHAKNDSWHESSLNRFNSHLIFWKYVKDKPYRVDIHLNKVLATAIPRLKSKDILKNKIQKDEVYIVSPEYELTILIFCALRGRKLEKHRLERFKQLEPYKDQARVLCEWLT